MLNVTTAAPSWFIGQVAPKSCFFVMRIVWAAAVAVSEGLGNITYHWKLAHRITSYGVCFVFFSSYWRRRGVPAVSRSQTSMSPFTFFPSNLDQFKIITTSVVAAPPVNQMSRSRCSSRRDSDHPDSTTRVGFCSPSGKKQASGSFLVET